MGDGRVQRVAVVINILNEKVKAGFKPSFLCGVPLGESFETDN